MANLGIQDELRIDNSRGRVVALACKMVGGGSDGSLDLCARVCLIDEHERILFHSYIKPNIPVTNYRYEMTGIRPEYLRDAMPLRNVSRKIEEFLCNGEPIWQIRSKGGRSRILVGHGLDHDLKCLEMDYPAIKRRDTAKYPPLMKTSKLSNSLKYLTKAYLGYDIQIGVQDPYEDCVATMKLYMRMKLSQFHKKENYPLATDPQNKNNFASWRQNELERMTPDQLLDFSRTCDGKEFVLDEAIAVRSQTIKDMVEDDCVPNVILLPNVHSKTMTKVIEYWKKHSEGGVSKGMLMDFDKAFVNVHHSILHLLS
ncbi:hypothetical protein RDI58_006460 [Solanum bulbocastanum]|uniref:RNA exonuclease 4 n=1 Tax=Solanum bulbocastanum TaxID=147425 RepID=A0AAN8UA19_SOLBU